MIAYGRIYKMKKLLGIMFLGLLWSNTEERIFYEFKPEFNLENNAGSW